MSNDQAFPFHRRKGLRRPYYVAPQTVIGYWGDAWLTTITTQTPPNPPKTP